MTPPPSLPSNVFSVPRTSISSTKGTATFSFRLPGAGTLVLDATGNVSAKLLAAKRFKVGKLRRTVSKAGTYKLTLKPSKAAKRVLRRRGKLKVSVKVSFTPRGGTARKSTRTVTLKLKKKKAGS